MNRANPKLIGAFVVGAVALVVIGVLLLGGAKFLTEKRTFVAYFEGSVKGLNVGAPVEFQGVRVGSVTDIQLQFLTAEKEFRIPVFIQIEPDKMTEVGRRMSNCRDSSSNRWSSAGSARSWRCRASSRGSSSCSWASCPTPRSAWWATARSRKFRRCPPRCRRSPRTSRKP